MEDAHPPSEEDEEGHHELQEVVAEGLEAVDPPWGVVQEVGHGIGHRLRLWDRRRTVSYTLSCTPQDPCLLVLFWLLGAQIPGVCGESPEQHWALESPMQRIGYGGGAELWEPVSGEYSHTVWSLLKGQ